MSPMNTEYKAGDRVQVLMHNRCRGIMDTGGGWSSDWLDGTIVKINPANIVVRTDQYYFSWLHSLPPRRVRPAVQS